MWHASHYSRHLLALSVLVSVLLVVVALVELLFEASLSRAPLLRGQVFAIILNSDVLSLLKNK